MKGSGKRIVPQKKQTGLLGIVCQFLTQGCKTVGLGIVLTEYDGKMVTYYLKKPSIDE